MEVWIGHDPEQFAARAEAFLAARIERNVLATVLGGVRAGRYAEAIFAVLTDARGETVAAALRTPPHRLLVTGRVADPDALLAAWLAVDAAPGGVSAEPELARALAAAWTARTGGHTEVHVREALHVLEWVIPPARPAAGVLRPADWRESAQLREWGMAFAIDAGLTNPGSVPAAIDHSIEQGRLYVWELEGQIVAMVGHTATVAATVRVGPVYTPSRLRGHGYATAATAALSQRLLDAGAERCMLYTDLANPVSNHIYAKLGYVRVADWEEIAFPRPGIPGPEVL